MTIKRISLVLMVVICALFNTNNAEAQMQAAKPIAPKVIKGVSLNASASDVWAVLSDPQKYHEYVLNISNFECNGTEEGAKMSFSIPNDKIRQQQMSSVKKQEYQIAFFITKSEYHHQPWVFRLLIGADEDKSFVQFEGIFSIDDKKKSDEMKALVEKEWLLMKQGLEKKFN